MFVKNVKQAACAVAMSVCLVVEDEDDLLLMLVSGGARVSAQHRFAHYLLH